MFVSGSNHQWKDRSETNIDHIGPGATAQPPDSPSQDVPGRGCREIEENI